jgi:hypothetical protein
LIAVDQNPVSSRAISSSLLLLKERKQHRADEQKMKQMLFDQSLQLLIDTEIYQDPGVYQIGEL